MFNSDQFQGLLQSGAVLYLVGLVGFIALLIILGVYKKRRAAKSARPLAREKSAEQPSQEADIVSEKIPEHASESEPSSGPIYRDRQEPPQKSDLAASAQDQSSLPDEEEHIIRADTVIKQRFPDKAATLKSDGQHAFEKGNFTKAQECFDSLLSLSHTYSESAHRDADVSDNVGVELYEADARYYLGLIAQQENDLTLACENWQLARSLYEKHDAQDRFKKVEKNMIDAQCPTDWFLNNF